METVFDVLSFLNKIKDVFLRRRKKEDLIRVKEVLTNLLQDVNSKNSEVALENVKELEMLSTVGDWHGYECSNVIETLCEDIKELYKEYKIKNTK